MDPISSPIVSEIVEAIEIIQSEFPELYRNLDETPIWLNKDMIGISRKAYQDYAETLELNITYFEKSNNLK
jgi:hypothetical protein